MQNKYGQGYLGDEWDYGVAKSKDGYTGSYQDFATGGYDSGYGFSYVDGYGSGVNDGVDESWGPRLDVGLMIPQYSSPSVNGVKQATPWISHPSNIKDFFRTGYSTSHNISLTSNTGNTSTRVSVGYRKQEGVMPNTNLMRYTAAVNSTMNINRYVDFNVTMDYTRSESDNLPMTEYGSNNPMQSMGQWFGRQVDMKDLKANWQKNGDNGMPYNWNSSYHNNPFWTMHNTNAMNKNRVFGKASLYVKPTSYLKFEGRLGLDNWNSQTNLITKSRSNETLLGFNKFTGGQFYLNNYNNTEINLDAIGTFDKKYGNLGVTLSVGGNYRNFRYNSNQLGAAELTVPDLFTISNVSGTPVTSMSNSWIRNNSVYASGTIGYKSWIFFDGSYRTDWSSTIKKSIAYPSLSLSVLPLEFVKGPQWLSYLKIRGNWAKVGTATTAYQTDPYYFASASTVFGVTQYSATTQFPPNNLVPEMVRSQEVGLEARFFSNRVGFDVAYYDKKTTNQIIPVTVSKATGYNSMLINAGRISNKGWEVQLTGSPFQNPTGFNWDITVNWSRDRSKIIELYKDLQAITLGSQWSVNVQAKPGQPWGVIVGTGMLRDDKGNIVVSAGGIPKTKASMILGNVNPDWLGSISNEFSYKGVSLGFLLDYRRGGDVFSVSQMFGTYSGLIKYTAQDDFREKGLVVGKDFLTKYNFVKADGTPNDIVVGAQDFFESYYSNRELSVFDGSFLKLREVHLSYDIPKRIVSKLGLINRATVSFVGTNIALLWLSSDNLAKIDPECTVSSGNNGVGLETTSAPQTRSLGFKVSLSF
jgi:outer membrane receptor protein involved in Fe transport